MYILHNTSGEPVCSVRTGEPFTYHSRALADAAARVFSKRYGYLRIVRAA